jgi:hypothetical protein
VSVPFAPRRMVPPPGVFVYTPGCRSVHAPGGGIATYRERSVLAPPPGSGVATRSRKVLRTHPPRRAWEAVLQAVRSPHSAAVRGVWEWLAHGVRWYGLRPDWPSFARRRLRRWL